ncbi:MAG: hypothetical protein E7462_01310 [Ruminococcaceae bacterium]|nr:hypothetical protein [Oscillospiraceae bacterium]
MKTNYKNSGMRKVLVTLIFYLSVILAALVLGVTHQIAGWVAQVAVALSLGRLLWLMAWGAAKNGQAWRV